MKNRYFRLSLVIILTLLLLAGVIGTISRAAPHEAPVKSPNAPSAANIVAVKINFQPAGSDIPTNYIADSGETKGPRGGGWNYGWSADLTSNTRERNVSSDQRLDTLVFDTNITRTWEIDIPNGLYKVTIAMGDPKNAHNQQLKVEGVAWWNTNTGANAYQIETHTVTVADGALTVDMKGTINYIDIVPSPPSGVYMDWGDAPDSYRTTSGQNGPRHQYKEGLYLGGAFDDEVDGIVSVDADGDDNDAVDDEDGLIKTFEISTADPGFKKRWTIGVTVLNDPTANVYGWIDFNRNGTFDANEFATAVAHQGDNQVTLEWIMPPGISPGKSYARFRITTDNLAHTGGSTDPDERAYGPASDGEVEDYTLEIRNFGYPNAGCLDDVFQSRATGVGAHFQFAELLLHENPIIENVLTGDSPRIADLVASPDDFNALGLNDNDEYTYAWYFDFTHGTRPVEWAYVTRIRTVDFKDEMQVMGEALADGPQDVAHGPAGGTPVVHHYNDGDPLRETFLAGDVDDNGYYYLSSNGHQSLVKIDLKNMTFTSVPLMENGSQSRLDANDFAYNSRDGYFYAIRPVAHANSNRSSLIRISKTGVITERLLDGKVPAGQGGAVVDFSNTRYALINNDGGSGPFRYYSVDVTDPTPNLAYLGNGSTLLRANDAAGCLIPRDYGDLPNSYLTKESDGGARHNLYDFNKDGVIDLYLGSTVDADRDGWVDVIDDSGNATDDDAPTDPTGVKTGNGDDEDGVTLLTPLIPGENACVKVSAHNGDQYDAAFHAWIDFDASGAFSAAEGLTNGTGGTGGNFHNSQALIPPGDTTDKTYCFETPASADFANLSGVAAMRFRLSMEYLNSSRWGGFVDEGEVEDYMTKLACIGNYVWDDSTGTTPNVQDSSDSPIGGLTVRLVAAGVNGQIDTAASDASAQGDDYIYTTTTASNGRYSFCGVPPGVFQIQIPTPPSSVPQVVSPNMGGDSALDSDGVSSGSGQAVSGPVLTYSDPISITVSDNASNDADPTGYPDAQTDLAVDFGFQKASVAIDDRVWNDADNDGVVDISSQPDGNAPQAETGIDGAKLNLYRDSDGDGVCEPGSDTFITTTTTSGGGFYKFLNLTPSTANDATTNYCVALDSNSVKPTYTKSSSSGGGNPDAADNNDDGIPSGNYVVTKPFPALLNSQTTTDSGDPVGYDDASSYMTVDFGLNTDPNAIIMSRITVKEALPIWLLGALAILAIALAAFVWKRRQTTSTEPM